VSGGPTAGKKGAPPLKRVPSTESRRRSFPRETAVNLLLGLVVLLGVIVVVAGTMFVTQAVFNKLLREPALARDGTHTL
jgi:hypothetical protein